jgi:hypothetical protein
MIIGTNFKLSSAKFLDDRQLCKDYATLIANAEGIIYPPGFEVFCEYENKYYQYVSDTNGGYVWEERKSGVSDGTSASIKDDTISEEYTWSSAHIDSMRIDLETLITQANDYVDEIDERMLFIEGKFQWFEYFDGSYESLSNKPTIPTKLSELENDSEFLGIERLELELESINEKIDAKIDKEEDRTLISVTELERLSTVDNYNDTEVRQLITELETQAHTHINSDILNTITEEKINQWDNNTGVDDYNYIQNKPIIRVGDDSDILLNFGQIIDEGMYIITAMVGEYKIHNELVHVKWTDDDNVTLTIPNMFMVLNVNRTDGVWTIVNELHYGVDKENGKISDTLTIGEDKIILDKEGNGWYGGKVSQEGTPTEDKDLITKGYVDNKFATNERVSAIEKENARRDVIIEALANGRRRTVETDGNDVDLMFSTEKDKVWIDKIEGETLVNVCDQEEPIAITKSYTVEGTNHVPLQGEYDGKARPVVHGNTLVNHNVEYDKSVITGEKLDNTHGTEILNLEGTPGCEIKVDIDGHTAINLSTKKEDILCKSFDSVSGNEINLVAEENSVSDLVIQGNTMVNLHSKQQYYLSCSESYNPPEIFIKRVQDINKAEVELTIPKLNEWGFIYGGRLNMSLIKPNTKYTIVPTTFIGGDGIHFANTPFTVCISEILSFDENTGIGVVQTTDYINLGVDTSGVIVYCGFASNYVKVENLMIFEGDLTQTPELIPTEYVEGLQSTFEDKLIPYSIYNGDNLTSITETQYQLPLTVEVGKTYTITTTANVGTTESHKYQYGVYSADGLTNYLEYESCSPTQTFVCDKANILFKVRMYPSYSGDDYSFVLDEVKDKFLIVEGDWSSRLDLLTEEYFGKYRVDMSSHGKNLFDINNHLTTSQFSNYELLENGIHFYSTGYTYRYFNYRIKVKKNTDYTVSLNATGTGTMVCEIYDLDNKWIKNITDNIYKTVGYFNSDDYEELNLRFFGTHKNETECDIIVTNIQLEEGSVATEYEPYHGSSKTVYLNSPLLDGDELLTKDGKLYHYHKMGMVVLNGSEKWSLSASTFVNCLRCDIKGFVIPNNADNSELNLICDRFLAVSRSSMGSGSDIMVDGDFEHITHSLLIDSDYYLSINILKSKLSTTDVSGFKQWLSENPTTVVYELAEPWYEPIGAYGKVVLDGSEEWDYNGDRGTAISFWTPVKGTISGKIHSNKFATNVSDGNDVELMRLSTAGNIAINIFKSRLSTPDLDGFKQWLQQNPVTVIYELANPQYIDEDMRFNIATNSTIEYQSSVPMANTQFLPYRNELPLLESSTQYRVTFDCDVEGIELMVSLGGTSQTITSALHNELSFITPSLQTDGKLTIDGYGIAKINNVLITKGDMEYKYFEGLKSGFEERKNKIIKVEEGFMDVDTGENVLYANDCVRSIDYIKIDNDKTYKFYSDLNYNFVIHEYDENKNHLRRNNIGNDSETNINIYTPSSDCKYIRFRTYIDYYEKNVNVKIIISDILDSTFEELYNQYEANIRIQNPNAPIFGKGGRL